MAYATNPVFLRQFKGLTSIMALLLCTQLPAQGGGQPPNEVLRLDTGFVSAPMGDLD